jgi:hypothetical protein
MMIKLATLFLVAMVVMALSLARPKPGEKRRRKKRDRPGVAEAKRCPECGAYVVNGEECPCRE